MHETQGTTRDRKELIAEWNGLNFLLIDTGGVDIVDPHPITRQIAQQARTAIAEADLVLFVVDARAGVTPGDEELAQILRESKKDVLLLANKIDDPSQASLALELHRLGFGDPFPISALHGSNTGDLLDEVLDRLPGVSSRVVPDDEAIRVAILGRPNVGKSSLLNKLLGEERAIVHDVPGTTRDTTDTVLEHNGRTFILVDTAGLRRKRKQRQGIDYYSELRALDAADRADVALVLIDSSEGIVEGDITAVEVARKSHSRDPDRALEVGHLGDHDRRGPARAAAPPAPAARLHHHLVADGPRCLAHPRQGRRPVRRLREPRPDRRAEQVPRRAQAGASAAVEGRFAG